MTDDYVGWAPLLPPGYSPELAPGGGYLYVTIASLAAPDLPRRARTSAQVGQAVALGTPVTVDNLRRQGGVVFNAGPAIGVVERRAGPLPRVRLEDLSPELEAGAETPSSPARPAPTGVAATGPARGRAAPARVYAPAGSVRRSGEEAAQRAARSSSGAPCRRPRSASCGPT